jgi:hypothetical protein
LFRALLARPADPPITCLCVPEFTVALQLSDQWRSHVGWIAFAGNHDAVLFADADGALIERRCQRLVSAPGELFGKAEPTADLDALLAPYGARLAEPTP